MFPIGTISSAVIGLSLCIGCLIFVVSGNYLQAAILGVCGTVCILITIPFYLVENGK